MRMSPSPLLSIHGSSAARRSQQSEGKQSSRLPRVPLPLSSFSLSLSSFFSVPTGAPRRNPPWLRHHVERAAPPHAFASSSTGPGHLSFFPR
uniref:Predicted protein n=1 Tax=Hordeum vulgare subsp. vulgare TaxID=112509 RepID=F2E499_HORVV|nr:predicted protein [Hordeum vulgare subsp. vulgare]